MRPTLFVAALGATLATLPASAALAQSTDTTARDTTASVPAASPAATDTTNAPALSLDEAITLALRHNPDQLSKVDARRAANAQRKAAYAAFLPGANANLAGIYQQAGGQPIQGFSGFNVGSDIYESQFSLGLTYQLNANLFLNPKIQSANVRAADADIATSSQSIRMQVTQTYLTVLQDQAKATLQDTLVAQDAVQLELAKAKMAVGSGTQLDVSQAEVAEGQAKVAALQAHSQVEIDKLRLFQTMGVPQPADVRLTTQFEVKPPTFTLDSVLALARQQNPTLNGLRARSDAAAGNVTAAKAQYFPTLQLNAQWGGYTYQYANSDYAVQLASEGPAGAFSSCMTLDSLRPAAGLPPVNCNQYLLTPQQVAQIRARNNQFPFNFTKQPFQLYATFSLPIFNGWQREQKIEQAEADRNTAEYNIRKQELATLADVTAAYLTVATDAKAVDMQRQNVVYASQQLQLAEEKYRVGAATYLDLATARSTYATAQNDLINAIYTYHNAFATLENAVGRPLR